MKLPETTWNGTRKARASHIIESTDGLFLRSSHLHHEELCAHCFPGFLTGLFCNNRVHIVVPLGCGMEFPGTRRKKAHPARPSHLRESKECLSGFLAYSILF